jgi:bis(5'-nucleosyl)-tetraphosphatase (symmetrical)
MRTWAIGDVQGCYSSLEKLLRKIKYSPDRDRLWFCGDLVSRGNESLEVLRFVRSLGDGAVVVLGNHDLHLLALAHGVRRHRSIPADLQRVLKAKDSDKLIDWLRHRPLLRHDKSLDFTLVHAGLPPQWNLREAKARAREVEKALRGKKHRTVLHKMYGDEPSRWDRNVSGYARLRFIINAFTRIRYCAPDGRVRFALKGAPKNHPRSIPWFRFPDRASASMRIVYGHWSTLGPHYEDGTWCIDGGCVWGGRLLALRLDKDPPRAHQAKCAQQARPG